MPPVVIANPILNSPFKAPDRHFRFDDEGITETVVDGRRESGYFLPIASPRKKGGQLKFETEWTHDRFQSSPRINRIRERVELWRQGGYVGCTRMTTQLLEYWNDPAREKKLFFCQREALETAIYLAEVASHFGDAWIENELRKENEDFNGGLPRLAMKMATGSGKTVVMAMLIAWQTLNKLEDRHDRRFSDAFLIVTPGITIRDRLRVLLPTDPQNYYRERDVVPGDLLERLGQARIVIANYHGFPASCRSSATWKVRPGRRVREASSWTRRSSNRANLIVEVTGEGRKDKAAKVAAATTLWVPAVNNHGGFGRWTFVEVTDPWDAGGTLRAAIAAQSAATSAAG